MAFQTLFQHLVVDVVGSSHKWNTRHLQRVNAFHQVICEQGNVLNAFAVELHQILFNLASIFARLFIQRNANESIGRSHSFAG